MGDYFDELISVTGNQYASKVADGMLGQVEEYIDTGSYILNALLSGSIYKGLPSNKITAFAGESATGKTFFILGLVKQFLNDNPTGGVLYFESESALTSSMIEDRGIDTNRFVQLPVSTIQEFAQQATRVVDKHIHSTLCSPHESKGAPLMLCLDSLGMLSTAKEVGDTSDGADKVDMTKARIVKGAFRVLTLKLAKAGIPLLVTNHTYKQVGCLTKDSYVKMSDGSTKGIDKVVVGDEVLTMSGKDKVTNTFEYDVDSVIEFEFENGEVVRCTPDHKFMTESGDWKRAEDLLEDDIILSLQ